MSSPPPVEERVSVHEGRRLRWVRLGEGDPLLLCHGFIGAAESFRTWFEPLARRRTLVVADLPGCGASDPLDGRHTADTLAAALEPLLDELGVSRFDLGGICLGAAVACALERRRPDAVNALVMDTPLLGAGFVRRGFRMQVRALTAAPVFPAVARLGQYRRVSDLYRRILVEGDDWDGAAADLNFANQQRALPRAAREWLSDGLRRDDSATVAGRAGPTLLLAAADDRIADVARLEALAAGRPTIELAVLDGAGHGWNESKVRRQLAIIGDFLDRHPVPRPAERVATRGGRSPGPA